MHWSQDGTSLVSVGDEMVSLRDYTRSPEVIVHKASSLWSQGGWGQLAVVLST